MKHSVGDVHPVAGTSAQRRQYIGLVQHASMTELAAVHPNRPTIARIRASVAPAFKGLPVPTMRGAKCDCVSGVGLWVRHQWPPSGWTLLGVEADEAPNGHRPDLWWFTDSGQIVCDEFKSSQHASKAALAQVRRQVDAAAGRWGDQFAGVRLYLSGFPARSLWLPAGGDAGALAATPFWFDWVVM